MNLDGLTLMAAGSFVAALASLLLFGAWTQIRSAPSLLWWSAACFADAIGVGVLAVGFASRMPLAIAAGAGLIAFAPALVWAGVRRFHGRRVRAALLAAGPAAWLAASLLPLPVEQQVASTAATFAISASYLAAAIVELWRGRGEPLWARWPLMVVFAIHAAIFVGGIVDVVLGHLPTDVAPPLNSWFSLIHFEQLIFLIGSAVFMVVICRERVELEYKNAARLDALTGVSNRRAFLERAERVLRRCHEDGSPCSVVVFDLDHFKQINDTYGHRTGDQVLRTFADAARAALRPNDLLGRHGGEEFAVVLPGVAAEAAYVIADRIRHAFATMTMGSDGALGNATVSAGVATAAPDSSLEAAMEMADRALYRAKRLGRNRVEPADGAADAQSHAKVIRVA
jgi:diguanylate cyclase (GGDEF)-like protein